MLLYHLAQLFTPDITTGIPDVVGITHTWYYTCSKRWHLFTDQSIWYTKLNLATADTSSMFQQVRPHCSTLGVSNKIILCILLCMTKPTIRKFLEHVAVAVWLSLPAPDGDGGVFWGNDRVTCHGAMVVLSHEHQRRYGVRSLPNKSINLHSVLKQDNLLGELLIPPCYCRSSLVLWYSLEEPGAIQETICLILS